jgi:HEAT repeat protein
MKIMFQVSDRNETPNRAAHRRTAKLLSFAFGIALAMIASAVIVRADDRDRLLLNRLVQSSATSDAALKAFVEGRTLIDDQKWGAAAERFTRFVAQYPGDKNVDAAYYYLAYAFKKQNKYTEAEGILVRLINAYPKSEWVDDAKKMRYEMNPGLATNAIDEADDEIRIIALQSLCQTQQDRCASLVNDVLRSGTRSSVRMREHAISLLGKYGGRDAIPVLIGLARNEPEEKLRIKAIAALGRSDDESVLEPLREQAMQPGFVDNGIVDTALHALANNDNPRSVQILGQLAMNAKTLEGRKHAVFLLSRRKGEPVVDELLRIYDADQSLEMRKQVVEAFGNRLSERALDKLVQIARGAGQIELRSQAVRSISHRSRTIPGRDVEQDLAILISLYDSERDEELKDAILSAIGNYQQSRRALQKLMEIVRSNAPVERRKKAITWLSRSKDPEVLRFLEDMLK